MVSNLSWASVRAAALETLTDKVIKDMTLGQFMGQLAGALSVSREELRKHKTSIKELVAQRAQEGCRSEEERQDEVDNDQEDSSSEQENDSNTEEESKGMMALRAMARAMNLHRSKKLFQGLRQMARNTAEATLKDRLIDAGAQFKGCFPSTREIAQARRRTETAQDMDGMDMGNVIHGSRRRGRSSDDVISQPHKKRRSIDTRKDSDSEGSEDDERGSAYEESEEEFQL